jgi:hypothetical protein
MRLLALVVSIGLVTARSPAQEAPPAPPAPPPAAVAPAKLVEPADEPAVGLRFEGWLPGTRDPTLAGTFKVAFAIYRSPQGGAAIWTESRSVVVERGRMDLVLGTEAPIPMDVHEATFKFLGASVDGAPEVYPRFAIVNVVYLSPEAVARVVGDGGKAAATRAPSAARKVVALEAQPSATWREALAKARAAGGDLPEYDEWYAALPTLPRDALLARSGRYEWVRPWVYDTASHGSLNDLFRGRFQGCDYMDLSPGNGYAWRLATPPPPVEGKEKTNQ